MIVFYHRITAFFSRTAFSTEGRMNLLHTGVVKCCLAAFTVFFFLSASAAKSQYSDYDWESNPKPYTPAQNELSYNAIYLLDKSADEHYYVYTALQRYNFRHIRIFLQTDDGIRRYNRLYIPTNYRQVLQLKARVIQPSGKIIELNEENIIESRDEQGKVRYRYFAFEGIEKGSTIEYLHYLRSSLKQEEIGYYTGHGFIDIDAPDPKKRLEAEVVTGGAFWFDSFSNGPFSFASRKANEGGVRTVYSLDLNDVAPMVSEPMSFKSTAQQRMYYCINITGIREENHWEYKHFAHEVMTYYQTKKGMPFLRGAVRDLLDATEEADATPEQRIRAFERQLKTIYSYVEGEPLESGSVKMKKIGEEGLMCMMLFAAVEIGITPEVVFTCNREEMPFSTSLQSRIFVRETMLHLPDIGYFQPKMDARIGPPDNEYIDNGALFIPYAKPRLTGTQECYVKKLPVPDPDHSTDELEVVVTIDPESLKAALQVDRTVSGYAARPYQSGISYLGEEERQALKKQFFRSLVSESAELDAYTFENDNSDAYNSLPLKGHADATSVTLVSEAGGKLLVNVGMLIGEQTDLYNETADDRTLPVELRFLQVCRRKIVIEIPAGYRVSNLSDLGKSVKPDAVHNSIGFTSAYRMDGTVLTVDVNEWYHRLTYPKEQSGYVIDVTNAAADFNKIVLVLEKAP